MERIKGPICSIFLSYINYSLTSKVTNSLISIRSRQNVGPDLGPNCLKGLSADGNVMKKFNAKLKYISST